MAPRPFLVNMKKQHPWRQGLKYLPGLGHWIEGLYRTATGRKNMTFSITANGKVPRDGLMVKIGAHDGSFGDPLDQLLLRRPQLRCVFVEPVPAVLERAKQTWGTVPRFTYVGAVINESGEDAPFFFVRDEMRARRPGLDIESRIVGFSACGQIFGRARSSCLFFQNECSGADHQRTAGINRRRRC